MKIHFEKGVSLSAPITELTAKAAICFWRVNIKRVAFIITNVYRFAGKSVIAPIYSLETRIFRTSFCTCHKGQGKVTPAFSHCGKKGGKLWKAAL